MCARQDGGGFCQATGVGQGLAESAENFQVVGFARRLFLQDGSCLLHLAQPAQNAGIGKHCFAVCRITVISATEAFGVLAQTIVIALQGGIVACRKTADSIHCLATAHRQCETKDEREAGSNARHENACGLGHEKVSSQCNKQA